MSKKDQEDLKRKEVLAATTVIQNGFSSKVTRDTKNELIRSLFKEGFECHDPSGTKKISSKLIQQVLWRVTSKIKFIDFQLHSSIRGEETERLTTDGFRTVANRGGLEKAFRDKGGMFWNLSMYGDSFLLMGKGEEGNENIPLDFRVLHNEDVYADNFCNGVRGTRPAQKVAVIYSYDKDEAWELYPELKDNNVFGRIPSSYQSSENKDDMDREQSTVLEICYFYNLTTKTETIFAGSQQYVIDQFADKEYPFIKNKKPYIPVFQFICIPSEGGFFNYGIVDAVYDLAIMARRLLNLQLGHTEESVYPLTLINAPQAKVDELVQKMAMAYKLREAGKKPVVAMEFGQGQGNQVSAQSLLTESMVNEWKLLWDTLAKEISRLGIYLDDVDRGQGFTAAQIYSEEDAASGFVKQVQEYNTSETQELVECILAATTEYVKDTNKSPINMTARVRLDDGTEKKLDQPVTLGMLAKEIKEGKYFCVPNSRTGSIPSDLMKLTQLEKQMASTMPGSPEYAYLYKQMAQARGIDMPQATSNEVVQPGSAPTAVQSQPGSVPQPQSQAQAAMPVSDTSRLQVNSRGIPAPL